MNFTTAIQKAQAPRSFVGPLALLFFIACSGSPSPDGVSPQLTDDARLTIDRFMAAVARNDIGAMSRLWGTKDGPAAPKMDPIEAERRLRLMQIYLVHESYDVRLAEGEFLARGSERARYDVRLTRRRCTPTVPFTLVRSRGGWLIENVDIAKAGNPQRECPAGSGTR